MIVDNRNVIGIAIAPSENQSPLPIDSNRVEAVQIPHQRLQVIARWTLELIELNRRVENVQLSERRVANLRRNSSESAGSTSVIQGFRGSVAKRSDHDPNFNAFTESMQGRDLPVQPPDPKIGLSTCSGFAAEVLAQHLFRQVETRCGQNDRLGLTPRVLDPAPFVEEIHDSQSKPFHARLPS